MLTRVDGMLIHFERLQDLVRQAGAGSSLKYQGVDECAVPAHTESFEAEKVVTSRFASCVTTHGDADAYTWRGHNARPYASMELANVLEKSRLEAVAIASASVAIERAAN